MRYTLFSSLTPNCIILALILAILNLADYALTCYLVTSDFGAEGNSILAQPSLLGMGLLKTGFIMLLLYLFPNRPKVLTSIISIFVLIVLWNSILVWNSISLTGWFKEILEGLKS